MKKLLIAGVVTILIVVGVLFFTLSNLGPLVKKTVNTLGPKITKTDVTLADVSVSIFSGEAKIKQFFLGNPKGFNSAQAMKVGSISVDIDEKSIISNPIVINKIEIIAPEITYEKIKGTDNFQTLLKNIQGVAKSEKDADTNATDEIKEGKKIIINNVIVKDGKVKLAIALLGGKEITAPLPDIHLKDIGKEKDGATPAEAFEKIFSSLYSSINADSVTSIFNDGLKQLVNIKDLGATGVEAGGETAKKAIDSVSKSVESATKNLKGLLKTD
jgi:flagellar hook-basal body complex protein FliE